MNLLLSAVFNNLSISRLNMNPDRWERAKQQVIESGIEYDIYKNVARYKLEIETISFMIPTFYIGKFPVATWGLSFLYDHEKEKVRCWVGERVSFITVPCYKTDKRVPNLKTQVRILRNFRRGYFRGAIRAAQEWVSNTNPASIGAQRPGMVLCSCHKRDEVLASCATCHKKLCASCGVRTDITTRSPSWLCQDHVIWLTLAGSRYVAISQRTQDYMTFNNLSLIVLNGSGLLVFGKMCKTCQEEVEYHTTVNDDCRSCWKKERDGLAIREKELHAEIDKNERTKQLESEPTALESMTEISIGVQETTSSLSDLSSELSNRLRIYSPIPTPPTPPTTRGWARLLDAEASVTSLEFEEGNHNE